MIASSCLNLTVFFCSRSIIIISQSIRFIDSDRFCGGGIGRIRIGEDRGFFPSSQGIINLRVSLFYCVLSVGVSEWDPFRFQSALALFFFNGFVSFKVNSELLHLWRASSEMRFPFLFFSQEKTSVDKDFKCHRGIQVKCILKIRSAAFPTQRPRMVFISLCLL